MINRNLPYAVVFALVLAGCGGNEATRPPEQHATSSARTGDTGLTLLPSVGAFLTFEQIEAAYTDTEACTGLSAPGPVVVFQGFGVGGPRGAYSYEGRQVTINSDAPVEGIANDANLQRQVLRHEFVHFLLGEAGVWGDDNAGHASPMFDKCGQIVTGAA